MPPRKQCPSCNQRLSPFAAECPVCGLVLAQKGLPRPLLFQATAVLGKPAGPPQAPRAINTPALGRVAPLPVDIPASAPPVAALTLVPDVTQGASIEEASESTFWRLVNLEAGEAVILVFLNAGLALISGWMGGTTLSRLYSEMWAILLPVHACLSWTLLMIPLVLAGQSPLMGALGIALDSPQPERRMSYSLFHLLSVACFPASFLCMVLTPAHRTLAELLTGQELMVHARTRLR